jgi:outer membrane protein insertion porin family
LTVAWEDRERDGFNENRVGGAIRVDRTFSQIWAGYARYGLDRVRLSDVTDPSAVEEQKLENLRLGNLSLAVTRVTYDNVFSRERGTTVNLGAALFARPLLSQATFLAFNASAAGVYSLRPRITVAGAVRLGLAFPFSQTDQVPISERFFAGGSNSLRGFARDSVGPKTEAGTPTGGEGLFLINQEFRFPIWRQFRGVLFYDLGNVYATVSDMTLSELRHVVGLGVRLVTPIGPFRLEYGRKLDREEGESAGELYLSVGYPF